MELEISRGQYRPRERFCAARGRSYWQVTNAIEAGRRISATHSHRYRVCRLGESIFSSIQGTMFPRPKTRNVLFPDSRIRVLFLPNFFGKPGGKRFELFAYWE